MLQVHHSIVMYSMKMDIQLFIMNIQFGKYYICNTT